MSYNLTREKKRLIGCETERKRERERECLPLCVREEEKEGERENRICVCVFDQVLLGDLVCSSLCGKQSLVQSLNDSIFTWKCSFHHSLSSINTTSNLHESACIMVLFLLLHSLNPTIMVDSRPH